MPLHNANNFADRLRLHRKERISAITSPSPPVPLVDGAKIVVHLIPESALELGSYVAFPPRAELDGYINTIGRGRAWSTYNSDGFLSYHAPNFADPKKKDYTQLFRNGIIEAADTWLFDTNANGVPVLVAYFDGKLIAWLQLAMSFLQFSQVPPPVYMFLTLLNVGGCRMSIDKPNLPHISDFSIDATAVLFPEIVIQNIGQPAEQIWNRLSDMVWQSFGFERSFHYGR